MLSTNTIVTRKPIAITMGDPAGIGPEIIVKAFTQAPEITSGCFIVGEQATLQRAAQLLGSDIKIEPILEHQIGTKPSYLLPRVLSIYEQNTGVSNTHALGQISAAAGKAACGCSL